MTLSDISNPLPGIPLVESPLFERLAAGLPANVRTIARQLHDDGFAVIDFPDDNFDDLATAVIEQLGPMYDFENWRKRKAKGEAGGLRQQDVSAANPKVGALMKALAANQNIIELLSQLYGRAAFPFQTLTFPVGTEQHFHTDSLHFSSIPEKFMCGVWVALEDIGPDQGPLVYYPGSHKLPVLWQDAYFNRRMPPRSRAQAHYEPAWESIVAALQLEPRIFEPKKGQALIWAANLLHGGTVHRDTSKTRWSHVTHYYFEDCTYITPIYSDPLQARYDFKPVKNLATGETVPHRYLGEPVDQTLFTNMHVEKRNLPADFKPRRYLRLNPDVAAAGVDASEHYLDYGIHEGRRYK
ncbi:MAG: phytanoyl-CoA dioxygenase family protein [Pseudomonadota bacterium]